ncbi:MAG: hypothetical protein K1Y01_20200 [Vicinamibacteria bacterium]|nr:hypothetical protein [Vicinamibacteria bacterium]
MLQRRLVSIEMSRSKRRARTIQRDQDIVDLLQRSAGGAASLSDRVHYDREIQRLGAELATANEAFQSDLKEEYQLRLLVVEEEGNLLLDIRALEDENSRRAGRPTHLEQARDALRRLPEVPVELMHAVPFWTETDLGSLRPLPSPHALNQYERSVGRAIERFGLMSSCVEDFIEATRLRESLGHVPPGTADRAKVDFATNQAQIRVGLDQMALLPPRMRADRAANLAKRAALVAALKL